MQMRVCTRGQNTHIEFESGRHGVRYCLYFIEFICNNHVCRTFSSPCASTLKIRMPGALCTTRTISDMQQLKSASLCLAQSVHRAGEVLVTSIVRLACLDADTLSPVRIPTAIKEAITLER